MNSTEEPLTFIVPLSFEAHAMAQRHLSQIQSNARQPYLKALAVYAVEFYLRCLGVSASSEQSDWRDPWLAKLIDVADLWVEPYGNLECCLVWPDAELLPIADDAWADRIGYMAVQLEPTLKSATLLGFTPTLSPNLPLAGLQSLAKFPAYLQSLPSSLAAALAAPAQPAITRLRHWLEGAVETGWCSLEDLLGVAQMPRLAVRAQNQYEITVRQAKLIDVGMVLGEQSVVLSLAITLNPDTSMNVLAQVYPNLQAKHLPPQLQLAMLSEAGELLQEVCSREQDNYIQLRHFRGEAGDSFELRISLGQISVSESFIL